MITQMLNHYKYVLDRSNLLNVRLITWTLIQVDLVDLVSG